MVNGRSVPGSQQYSIAQWKQFVANQNRGGKGSVGGKGQVSKGKGKGKATPAEPTRSIYKASTSNGSATKPPAEELPNWTCPKCKFTANWPHRQRCVVCSAPVPGSHTAKLAKHLGLTASSAAAAATSSGTKAADNAPKVVNCPKLDGKVLQKRLQELQAAEAVLVREGVSEQEVAKLREEQQRVRGLNYSSKDEEAKLKFHEQRRKALQESIDAHPGRCEVLQEAVDKAEQQVVQAKDQLAKHIENLQPWKDKLKFHDEAIEELKIGEQAKPTATAGGTVDQAANRAVEHTISMVSSLLDTFATANPSAGKLVEALSELIKNSVQQGQAGVPAEEDDRADDPMQQTEGAEKEAEADDDGDEQTLEQIQAEIEAAAAATRAAQQRASVQKANADRQEQEHAQLLTAATPTAEDLLREQAELAQRAAQAEAAEHAKRQAKILLQAERGKTAEATRVADAEEQRANGIARGVAEAKAQREKATKEAEAMAAEMARHAHETARAGAAGDECQEDETLDEKDPKKAKDDDDQTSESGEAPNASKGGSGSAGGKGKGSAARTEAQPYAS